MTDSRYDAGTATPVGAGWGWLMAWGVLSILLGVFSFLNPISATVAATVIVGWVIIVAGVMALIAAFGSSGHDRRLYLLVLGVVAIVLGAVTAFQPLTGAASITMLIAAWLLARGVVELVLGFRLTRHKGAMIALGVVNIVLALLIVFSLPFSALTLPGYVLGVSFLLGGVAEVSAASAHRRGAPAFAA